MFKLLTAIIGILISTAVLAEPQWHKPRSKAQLLTMYPDAVMLSEGAYQVQRGDKTRVFMFGLEGRKYHLQRVLNTRAATAKALGVDQAKHLDKLVLALQKSVAIEERRSRVRAKTGPVNFSNYHVCGNYLDVDLAYTGGFSTAGAYAYIEAEPDTFSPAWDGNFYLIAYAAIKQGEVELDYDDDYGESAGSAFAAIEDSFGSPSTCTVEAQAIMNAVATDPDPEASCADSWMDIGPCV